VTGEEREVVVVGGGPAGCAAASFLRQAGHDVLLLDAARFPRDKVCGEGISPEAWRLLKAMGACPAVRALRPQPLHGMRLTAPNGTTFAGTYGSLREPGFAVRRTALDETLLAATRDQGVEVREGRRVADLLLTNGRVTGVFVETPDRPQPIHARLVVGADGRHGVVGRKLGLLHEHPTLRKFAVRGYWEGVEGLVSMGEMHVGGGGYCGIAPLGPREANVAFVLDQSAMAEAAGDLEGFYRQAFRRWPRIAERLEGARLLERPCAIGPLALKARRVTAPGAVLVGDAAGFYDPFTGEGVTLALRSAELAAAAADAALRAGHDDFSAYEGTRREATRHKFRLNHLLQLVVSWPEVSNAVAAKLARRPDLADQLVGIAGDFVPARTALGPRFLAKLLAA
jgi:geranylgeranyl reductase family protein